MITNQGLNACEKRVVVLLSKSVLVRTVQFHGLVLVRETMPTHTHIHTHGTYTYIYINLTNIALASLGRSKRKLLLSPA